MPHHYTSDFYDVPAWLKGKSSLTEVELPLLGAITDKYVTHLQCHFGLDTLSLARLGAKVTGVDFSPVAIAQARQLAMAANLDVNFIEANVYDAASVVAPADMVFTTYGVLGWLPDLDRWAGVVADCLKPEGELILVEFHPVLWMFDNDFIKPIYSYFNGEPILEEEPGTYANNGAPLQLKSIGWNHSLAEVFNALKKAGMNIVHFDEHDFSPFPAFNNSVPAGKQRWHIKGLEGLLPMVYSLKEVKLS